MEVKSNPLFLMAVLKVNIDFCTLLIGVEGTKTPAGVRGSPARPRKAKCLERKSTDKLTQPI
ncbi:hypothetical protein ACE198_09455 [Neobacillus sp. KR4-4]|uniref:hypothetical protein n=1 Tax=Neobacillus sp. KR4-4 TaxID=3344872 RepID=UPI0035CA0B2B